MMGTGAARRNKGSAVRRRRYAGLAIDCARPLMESLDADALATWARAIKGLRCRFPLPPRDRTPHIAPNQYGDWNRWRLICRESAGVNYLRIVTHRNVSPIKGLPE